MLEVLSNLIGLVAAIISVIGIYIQNRLSAQEQNAFRQQLISLLHHAEGIKDSASSIQQGLERDQATNIAKDQSLNSSLDSLRKNAEAFFFGIMETKVGGKKVLDDLDEKYKQWSKLELDKKLLTAEDNIEFIKELQARRKVNK